MPISALTNKMIAYPVITNFNACESIDWAIEMITLGYENENILILAGLSKPCNYFETIKYLNAALSELNLQPKSGESGIVSYAHYLVSLISSGSSIRRSLAEITDISIDTDSSNILFDFRLLNWAWGDLDYNKDYQHYWEGADINNIEQITIDVARQWLSVYSI
ncbi:hypothetical protein [Mucilaginibacter sp.]|uniref:hypothetical protein n=1 Tax=Mucilaginibacter sp. TaxID=1882438 RepID=UPI0032678F68